ncbi:NifB/NifX family molybdenum-iron cluster-binding protein [Desulfallas sp. Bu1-1]|jgi:predicted Fe-Mo cluster-binding NifX family protein|uniref:NifB/NifX family molybdenum-iron cluster-binding protein n=1 Tax=Desulfallas sp. Bu1-1 TaxID=2787620 RepID=UPI00189D5845|nr:NifB/NifX family molybdenum-iron cluster-binding protein [Desulfallas sp. Bu1-1]MBF7081465.1 NifB/NifX family molybdenum-iron cluster-binding protein [Desulfallas sp. Bu1-1]
MRIAVGASGPSKDAPAEERFGRCAYFVVFDENGNVLETINNEGAASAEGAGIRTTQILLDHNVNVVLTGRVGPKAINALLAGGVAVYTGVADTVSGTLENYKKGLMQPLAVPNARQHSGKGPEKRVVK